MICPVRTRKTDNESYCYRVDDTKNQVLSNNTGQDASDPNKSGPFWHRANLERAISSTKDVARQEGCANPTIDSDLDQIAATKEVRGHVID